MYPSGAWEGFWQQAGIGRRPMRHFELHFAAGVVTGGGVDVVGVFTFAGGYDERTGRVRMVKQYLGKHQVEYDGTPDGEGSIVGTWRIDPRWAYGVELTGAFGLRPAGPPPDADAPIREIGG